MTKNNRISQPSPPPLPLPLHRRRQGRYVPTFEKSRSAYDYNNVWIRKTDGTNTTIFIPENYQTTVQLDNNTVSHHYLWTPQTQDKLLADTTADGVLWSLTDHLGTIRDTIGETSTHLIYDAFGNLTSGTNPILFGYTGKAFDTSTALQNNINRWYDSAVGRWISTDPISFLGSDSSLYRYCSNMVLVGQDPQGEWFHIAIGGIIGGVVGAVSSIVSDIIAGNSINTARVLQDTAIGAIAGGISAITLGTGVAAAAIIRAGAAGGATGGALTGARDSFEKVRNDSSLTVSQKTGIIIDDTIIGGLQGVAVGAVTAKVIDVPVNRALSKTHLIVGEKLV